MGSDFLRRLFLTHKWQLPGPHSQWFITLKLPDCSFLNHVATLIRSNFFLHDVIILCTLHVIQSQRNVVNDAKSSNEGTSFLFLQGDFFQLLVNSDLRHIHGNHSLLSTRNSMSLSPDLGISAWIVKTHVKEFLQVSHNVVRKTRTLIIENKSIFASPG